MRPVARDHAVPDLTGVLDRLVTLEPPVNGLPDSIIPAAVLSGDVVRLYGAALRRLGRPLADAAAAALLSRTRPGDRLFITTGLVAPGVPQGETDGPAGAVTLARAMILGRGVRAVVLTEAEAVPVLEAAASALAESEGDGGHWRGRLVVRAFPNEPRAATALGRRLWDEEAPTALVSVEKLGPNARGVIHNMLGQDVTATQARSDLLFALARRTGTLTIGIGDRGNEIGLGGLLPRGRRCACPCGGGIACSVRAGIPIVAFNSNWGAHAVVAALAMRLGLPHLLHRPRSEARMLRRMVRAGAVDGVTRRRRPTVDGGSLALQSALLGLLAALVETGIQRPGGWTDPGRGPQDGASPARRRRQGARARGRP